MCCWHIEQRGGGGVNGHCIGVFLLLKSVLLLTVQGMQRKMHGYRCGPYNDAEGCCRAPTCATMAITLTSYGYVGGLKP